MTQNSLLKITDRAAIKGTTATSDIVEGNGIIINTHQNHIKTGRKIELKYTIKQGDYERLNREGFLEVYNLTEEIKIPVRQLLGKWRKAHIGITLIKTNERWQIDGEQPNIIAPGTKKFIGFKILKKHIASLF